MNIDDLIYQQISKLQTGGLSASEQDSLRSHLVNLPEEEQQKILEEVDFVEFVWGNQNLDQMQQPTPGYASEFFAALEKEKSQNMATETQIIQKSIWQSLATFLGLEKPVWRLAAVGLVFIAGMGTQGLLKPQSDNAISDLESQVTQLNAMVAMSLLQKNSAAERLSGVAYSMQSTNSSDQVVNYLLTLLSNDSSSAVRLAIVQAFATYGDFYQIEDELFEKLWSQDSVMVQLQIIELLVARGSTTTLNKLNNLTNDERLLEEVRAELNNIQQQTNI